MKLLPLLCAALLAGPLSVFAAAPAASVELKWDHTDLGPFQAGTFKVRDQITAKGIAIRVQSGEERGTVLFDPELLRWSAAWPGGFLLFPRARGGLEGQITPDGTPALITGYAPGWAPAGDPGTDPREKHQGHLPPSQARWRGLYAQREGVVLSYEVHGTPVHEVPGLEKRGDKIFFTRTLRVEKTAAPLSVLLCDLPGGTGSATGSVLTVVEQGKPDPAAAGMIFITAGSLPTGAKLRMGDNGRALLDLPALSAPALFRIRLWSGPASAAPNPAEALPREDLVDFTTGLDSGAPARWGEPLETRGTPGTGEDAYVVDEVPFPEENRYGSWFRPGGHDFLPDGRAVVASLSGDVWLVSGLDSTLEHVRWQRFATGLFQPLGCKVVKGEIYVLGRDQITRLHDLNGDGEADWYENFNNDCVVTENYHEFALDLQTDSAGNFYFAKGSPWQPTVTSPHQGCLLKVSPDGRRFEVVATGLRAPNGMAIGPHDEITVSDNQGHWMPANRLNIVHPGGFYGMVPAAHRPLTFDTAEGTWQADPSSAQDQARHHEQFWGTVQTPRPREGYDLPLCWLPMPIDNSSGGEVWVPEGQRWGPLGGRMLQMSYGKCALFLVLAEEVDGVPQAGLVKFPLKFSSGIMRGRFSPADGQLWLTGLRVWQSDAAKDGLFCRVRYTGQPLAFPIAQRTLADGLEITFSTPLAATAADADLFDVTAWNYLWSGAYGSPDFSVQEPGKKGRDVLEVKAVKLSPDRRTVTLQLGDWSPAMQTRVQYHLTAEDGHKLDQEIWSTVHRVPGGTRPEAPSPATPASAPAAATHPAGKE